MAKEKNENKENKQNNENNENNATDDMQCYKQRQTWYLLITIFGVEIYKHEVCRRQICMSNDYE